MHILIATKALKCSFVICLPTLVIAASANSAGPEKDAQQKSQYDQLLLGVQREIESQKDQVTRTQQELSVQREQVNAVGLHLMTTWSFQLSSFPGLRFFCFCLIQTDSRINSYILLFVACAAHILEKPCIYILSIQKTGLVLNTHATGPTPANLHIPWIRTFL